jgi:hypothetical protein
MAYIPKNRIKSNLYTAGGEFYLKKDNTNYIGYYYSLFTNKFFTGKTPNDTPNYELIRQVSIDIDDQSIVNNNSVFYSLSFKNENYNTLKGQNLSDTSLIPQLSYPKPTESDYELGEFQRYFCKKRNEFTYLEISKSDYDKLKSQSFTIDYINWNPLSIPWTLTGDESQVYNTNRNIVLLKEKNEKFYGFEKYLRKDYLRYYKP